MTTFGLGPRRSFTTEELAKIVVELAKMAVDELLEDGWRRAPTPGGGPEDADSNSKAGAEDKTQDELDLERIHNELENVWKDDVKMPEKQSTILVGYKPKARPKKNSEGIESTRRWSPGGPEIEELKMYYNDKLEIDFEDSDDEE
ncbi:hypothetical protein R1sor_003662 [Riccia sorocarpa]|uniref:Uncharacterized protein n=1 Tax=Riccia sorocarpa TaxID=122646 RepID=A0ABD3H5P9_9MARC